MAKQSSVKIPRDLREYLNDPKSKLEFSFRVGEIRRCVLKQVSELEVASFAVYPFNFAKRKKKSLSDVAIYEGVDLLRECSPCAPEGMLVWFPTLKIYGAYNSIINSILIFPIDDWSDIRSKLRQYLNAKWYPGTYMTATERN